jgi:hypothetical protein
MTQSIKSTNSNLFNLFLRGHYGRAVMMNLKAMLLVAIVLAAAACYEAMEVILMNR